MFNRVDNSRLMLVMAIAVAIVAIAVPTSQMIGCTMDMSGGMPFFPFSGTTVHGICGGVWVTNTGPAAVLPETVLLFAFALVAAIATLATRFSPRLELRAIRITGKAPPPPPEDPRGERLLI